MQALVKLALEPEWEARFEPNSYGFRPGRSAHDAIEAIFNFTRLKSKYVLDADIAQCFDRINHTALLQKLHTIQPIARLVRGWLKAGILDPTKVVKTALSNAASIAGLMLTTEALVTNFDSKDDDKKAVVGSIR